MTTSSPNSGASCKVLTLAPDKSVASPLKRLVRRAVQVVRPIHARVRFDTQVGKWALLGASDEPMRHFTHGIMTNVRFTSVMKRVRGVGCGGGHEEFIGIAEGSLVENHHGRDLIGFANFGFSQGHFRTPDGEIVTQASKLRLLSDRRAMYKA